MPARFFGTVGRVLSVRKSCEINQKESMLMITVNYIGVNPFKKGEAKTNKS